MTTALRLHDATNASLSLFQGTTMGPARGLALGGACTTHVFVSNLRCFQACSRTVEELGRCDALRVGAYPITRRSSSNPDIGFVGDFAGHQLGAGVCGKVRDGSNVRASCLESTDSSTSSCFGEQPRDTRILGCEFLL